MRRQFRYKINESVLATADIYVTDRNNKYNFRPAIMKATKGQVNVKTIYKILVPLISPFFRQKKLTLKQVGQAMVNAVLKGYPRQILEVRDIEELANQ